MIDERKNVQTTHTRTYCKRNKPLPYYHPNCRTPRHWKFTQDHRTTRPPPRQKNFNKSITPQNKNKPLNRIKNTQHLFLLIFFLIKHDRKLLLSTITMSSATNLQVSRSDYLQYIHTIRKEKNTTLERQ